MLVWYCVYDEIDGVITTYRRLGARLQYLQRFSNGGIPVFSKALDRDNYIRDP